MIAHSVSIVIPVYNSAESLPTLVGQLDSLRGSLAEEMEVILVNDGSQDRSAAVMAELAHIYRGVRPISLLRNYGQHNALLCGIRKAANEIIVTMDDDLQNPVEEIEKLLLQLQKGYDVVYGYPERESHGMSRDLASRITKLALRQVMGVETARHVSSFRAFRAEIREAFRSYDGAFVSIDVLLSWGTSRFSTVPVRNPRRTIGKSNYTVAKLTVHAMNMMTGFTVLPLQLASVIGFAVALFGVCILVYVVIRYFIQGDAVPGFPFLASIVSIFSGVQLFALGIIGEYLARMHFRLMNRPSYAERSRVEEDD